MIPRTIAKGRTKKTKFFIVLPVYKSRQYLLRNLPVIHAYMKSLGVPFGILIAEDGSGDVFDVKVQMFIRTHKNVQFIHFERKLGRGRAMKNAVRRLFETEAKEGDVIGYMDIDLATDISAMKGVVEAFETGEYDIVTGSRYAGRREGGSGRTAKRLAASMAFNFLVRLMLGSRLEDHQCGFKFFRAGFIRRYASRAKDDLWFWDTEILVLAQRDGKNVFQLPVIYREANRSTVKMASDTANMFGNIVRLSIRLRSK